MVQIPPIRRKDPCTFPGQASNCFANVVAEVLRGKRMHLPGIRRGHNALHAQVQRLDRGVDKIAPEMKDLGQEQDGSEIKSRELELVTDRVQNLGDRRDAFEAMRDLAAEGYRTETGDTWRPRNGSTANLNGVDPQAWLTDVLNRIADHKITRLSITN